MKKILVIAITAAAFGMPTLVVGADFVGFSAFTTISKIHSGDSRTLFRLTGYDTAGCGHPDFWVLPLNDSVKSKAKLSMLLAGYISGKQVSLRCEIDLATNISQVTDFEIKN